jgi:2,4-dienoyl-CoA reductase-like NADH-dependent reductase (Old Yellow Enzyme family)
MDGLAEGPGVSTQLREAFMEKRVTNGGRESYRIPIQSGRADSRHDLEVPEVNLLTPLVLRDVTFRNRIAVAPMCQYSAEDGFANDWHLVHLGSRAVGGAGHVMVEATAVLPEGRITPGDLGLWGDTQIAPLQRIASFIKSQRSVAGIQLAHAGRKASCEAPWKGGRALGRDAGGWPVVGPSAIPFDERSPVPTPLDLKAIEMIITAFETAAWRALEAGFEVIEIHAAHGYLLHEFLSPLSNDRMDEYGGSFENRTRLLLKLAERLRALVPQELPLFVRISATDWVAGGWDIDESVELAKRLKTLGVDLIDVSSGGMTPTARIPLQRGFQVPFARRIRDEAELCTGAVGMISDAQHADEIITGGDADLVFIAREFLREPYWGLNSEHKLDAEPHWPIQYGYAIRRHI